MKRKITCLVLTLALCLTSMQVFAVKRGSGSSGSGSGDNIIPYGSFNSAADVAKLKKSNVAVSYIADGATSKGGAAKIDITSAWGYAYVEVPNVIGETYDISYYARIDDGTDSMQFIPMFIGGSWDTTILSSTYTSSWTKYTCTYVCDGKTYNGTETTAAKVALFNVRRGSGDTTTTYYLDELKVVPRGNVEYDWSSMLSESASDVIPADTGFSTPQPVVEASFDDTKGHWAESTINLLAASSYVQGMGDGTYAPENNVTRAEFVTMAMNLLRLDGTGYRGSFKDVSETDWFAKDVQTASDIGLIDPLMTVGGTFKPNQPITREEAATVLYKVAEMRADKPDTEVDAFADDASVTAWAKDSVYAAAAYGLIKGYPDGSFGPLKGITRAEAASMIFRVVELNSRFAVYVDGENGNDRNDGTVDAPLATIDAARKLVRPMLKTMQNHIYVFIKEGRYVLDSDVIWGVGDSGCNGFSVIYTSQGDEEPVISMGEDYSDFQLYDEDKNIYRTFVGKGTETRQVYINGVRGVRARNEINVNGAITNAVMYVDEGYYICDDVEFADFENQDDIELVYFEQWTNPRVRVESIEKTADGKAKINMVQQSWAAGRSSGNCPTSTPVYVENAYELLDSPGEWYMNKKDGYLYYMPRDYEDPTTMKASVPVGERAFTIAGDSADEKVHNLKFNNLAFEYITWLWPSTAVNAYRDEQANHVSTYNGDGRLTGGKEDAAVIVADAAYIDITNCTFSKLGGAGLNFRQIFQNCNVIGNHFYDLSGSGMNIGVANKESGSFDKYFKPSDYKNYRIYNKFNNNFIHDVSVDYMSAVGINASVGLKDTEIFHNEIYNVNYSGMHVGWGWGGYASQGTGTHNLDINYNYVHDTANSYVYDCGSVYLLGATGGSEGDYNEMNYNYFENHRNSYGAAYPDEGSTYWEITGNVIDLKELNGVWPRKNNAMAPRWLHIHINTIKNNYIHDNYATTGEYLLNSPENDFEQAQIYEDAEWPEEAQRIMDEAGLEPEYLDVYPDSIQRLRILNEDKKHYVKAGDTVQMDVVGYKRKLNEVKIPNEQLDYYSTNDAVAKVDENGLITGVGSGQCAIYVEYLDDDVIRKQYIEIVCDDIVTEINSNVSALNILEGYEASISAEGKTRFGNIITIDEAEYTVEDPTIASVTDGKVKGLKEGSTVVHAVYTADGVTLEKEYPVSVITYVNENTLDYIDKSTKLKAGHSLFNPTAWNHGTKKEGDGILVSSSSPAYYMTRLGNELISFDMTINPNGHTWPSFAIRNARPMESYTSSDTYMMGFKKDIIEVQRFNNGKRTMIFGDSEFSPVGGPGYPNELENGEKLLEYGERYSVTVGALDEENGVRLILIVNDKPIFDFLDTADGYIKGDGLFGLYPSAEGNFILQPYTGLKFTEEQRTGE